MAFREVSPSKLRPLELCQNESRRAHRFILEAQVNCAWMDTAGHSKDCEGTTRDVSQRGAYVLAQDCPPRGAKVRLVITLPAIAGESRPLRIESESTVLRIEKVRRGLFGFAVSNHRLIRCNL
ncbi:MAG TPA: PilZ domain-containing protein [Candidatus Micrarchaeaceae archaeon]|nr:PilZ domain-containing protein [Candidatus Micrarchaeaceae archaeon]